MTELPASAGVSPLLGQLGAGGVGHTGPLDHLVHHLHRKAQQKSYPGGNIKLDHGAGSKMVGDEEAGLFGEV